MLALDWAKAFDCFNVNAILRALHQLGVPEHFVGIIKRLLEGRRFFVEDHGVKSRSRAQLSGVSQGCPLSPLLFIMIMTVMMHDAVELLPAEARAAYDRGDLADIVYADDTLLLGMTQAHLQHYLHAITLAGKAYGLELHVKKFQLINVRCQNTLTTLCGSIVEPAAEMSYLGTILTEEGCVDRELNARIGMAKKEFRSLSKVWSKSILGSRRKIRIFETLVLSKLMYGLAACCLNAAQRRRLDGFNARCLRQILGIGPAFETRVSNAAVLQRAGKTAATEFLLRQQLSLFGKALRAPPDAALHTCAFVPGSALPAVSHHIRRRGRPRTEWVPTLLPAAESMSGHSRFFGLRSFAEDQPTWKAHVNSCPF